MRLQVVMALFVGLAVSALACPSASAAPAPAARATVASTGRSPTDPSSPSTPTSNARPAGEQTVDFWSMLFVFVLDTFIGLGVIGRVSRLLHTPLMSLTNAISAIAVVGSITVTGSDDYPPSIRMLGVIALFASMTNIVSGFLITDRMLKMFKQARPTEKS